MNIFDLDNCISDDEWRLHHINKHHPEPFMQFHSYHLLAGQDRCVFPFQTWMKANCIVITSRPEWYRPLAHHWLLWNGFTHFTLLMRATTDLRPSVVVKESLLFTIPVNTRKRVRMAYDDLPEVVDMYKSHGVQATLLAINRRK